MERCAGRRSRHPGHDDANRALEVLAAIRSGRHRALELEAPLIRVDAGEPPDVEAIVARIR